jgi:outer membrane protein assembly factor BamE (lipoprotein component of BamABCDE complex)
MRQMKRKNEMNHSVTKLIRRICPICLIALLAFAFSACNSQKTLTKANVNEVVEGMSKKQVESILGLPTTTTKTTYIYAQGKESVTVVFKDDKVQSKASTLSD